MKRVLTTVILAALAAAARGAAGPPPKSVGQILAFKGSVDATRADGTTARASLLLALYKGDTLTVPRGGSAEVLLWERGARFSLAGGAAVEVGAADLLSRAGPKPRRLRAVKLPPPATSRLNLRALTVVKRGAGPPAKGFPYGALRDFPVTLRWSDVPDAGELALAIEDEEKNAALKTTVPAGAHEFAVPAEALLRGKFYLWTVAAPRSPTAAFGWVRILQPHEKAALEFLERETTKERASAPDNPAPVLLLAQTYERLGMMDEAMAAYQSAALLRPNDAGLQETMKRLAAGP